MGRTSIEPLHALDVAQHYDVMVWSPLDIQGISPTDLNHLLNAGQGEWSGFTVRINTRHLVVVNVAQSGRRQNSVIMHELAHIILGHEPANAIITEAGHLVPSTYDQNQEDEAAWLGSTLLIPRPALLWMRRRRMSDEEAANYFAVSPDLLKWRIRTTGIDYQLTSTTRKV